MGGCVISPDKQKIQFKSADIQQCQRQYHHEVKTARAYPNHSLQNVQELLNIADLNNHEDSTKTGSGVTGVNEDVKTRDLPLQSLQTKRNVDCQKSKLQNNSEFCSSVGRQFEDFQSMRSQEASQPRQFNEFHEAVERNFHKTKQSKDSQNIYEAPTIEGRPKQPQNGINLKLYSPLQNFAIELNFL